jgi:hypothetical protein
VTAGQETDMYLPASPTARRREEALLVQARLERIDAQLNHALVMSFGGASAPPTPPTPPQGSPMAAQDPEAQRITTLARDIGQDKILLPEAITINRAWAEDDSGSDEMIATSITFEHPGAPRLTFTIKEALRLGILTPDGRFDHYRASAISHCMPRPGEIMRPHHLAAVPGRPSL